MTLPSPTRLSLIRHATALTGGRMAGRRDVAADCSDTVAISALRAGVGPFDHLLVSPAIRCVQTAAALWPEMTPSHQDPALWEQDFGAWEVMPYERIPDLGPLTSADLATLRPPHGESFADICARIQPALVNAAELGGHVVIVAHAGTVRAALAHATGSIPAALAFQVAPLSLTVLGCANPNGAWSVAMVNRIFA